MRLRSLAILAACGPALGILGLGNPAAGQSTLPPIDVTQPQPPPKKKPAPVNPGAANAEPASAEAAELAAKTGRFDSARSQLSPKTGANSYDIGRDAIQALPQGADTPIEKVLLQTPGVTQDSAASGDLHIRNEHANIQYRVNGIMLPDGVSGFGQVLDTRFVGNLSLITGALPAQFGLRTAGIVDITTRNGFENGGAFGVYGGSHGTIAPNFEYSGTIGNTEYFFTGRYLQDNLGLENPTSSPNAIHDFTRQESGFGYVSTVIDDSTRLSLIFGTSVKKYQIPDNPGQMPAFTAFGITAFDSARLNENQFEQNHFAVLALQKSFGDVDLQLSYFSQYSSVHFMPDTIGDLMFNGAATDVFRSGFTNGIQADAAYHLNQAHTLRAGFSVSGEQTQVANSSQLLPVDAATQTLQPFGDIPFGVVDSTSKLGWLIGTYVQDEWRITDKLTLNTGLRFDQMYQFVDANQFSPRVGLTYKPFEGTVFHAGYARNFTPPSQVIATPTNTALFAGCTPPTPGCTTVQQNTGVPPPYGPVLPERSNVFDVGVTQKIFPGFEVGIDAYYKLAKDLLDDGQFGAAYVLNGFNYAQGKNVGVELKAAYTAGNFRAYANLAWAQQMATKVVSNQYLFTDPVELAYIDSHWIFTDHSQNWTGSAGASYLWNGTRFSADLIYGSGLRAGFANSDHVPYYTQVNVGISHDFKVDDGGPLTARFDIVNLFDKVYEIRDGSGIGVFAPQFGPRRGYFVGLSKRL
ncbi:MAG TPA: TonB-dependent receptor [Xanthobacteraceae bacterium]|nr:TonB-dependent receptor [Xanthobacteraceae bacterium]